MVKRIRVAHDADVFQSLEEYQRAETRGLFLGGFGQLLPEVARGVPIEIDSRFPKDSPYKARTVVTVIVSSRPRVR